MFKSINITKAEEKGMAKILVSFDEEKMYDIFNKHRDKFAQQFIEEAKVIMSEVDSIKDGKMICIKCVMRARTAVLSELTGLEEKFLSFQELPKELKALAVVELVTGIKVSDMFGGK